MANIQERRDKSGKLISYSIRVFRGRGADGKQLKPFTATFEVATTWTEKRARKKAEAFAATFEKECKEGTATDTRQTFASYCDYVVDLKEQRGAKHSTIVKGQSVSLQAATAAAEAMGLKLENAGASVPDYGRTAGRNSRSEMG